MSSLPFDWSYVADKFAVVATLQLSFTSKPLEALSTYSFVASESEAKPALSLYPLGTVTVPVPCGVKVIFLFAADVAISCPSIVKWSTTTFVNPAMSVVVPPRVNAVEPKVTPSFASLAFVTALAASCVVQTPRSCTLIVTVLLVTAVSIVPSPLSNRVELVE